MHKVKKKKNTVISWNERPNSAMLQLQWLWRTFWCAPMRASHASASEAVSTPSRCPLLPVVISILALCSQLLPDPEGPIRPWQLCPECHRGMDGPRVGGWGCCAEKRGRKRLKRRCKQAKKKKRTSQRSSEIKGSGVRNSLTEVHQKNQKGRKQFVYLWQASSQHLLAFHRIWKGSVKTPLPSRTHQISTQTHKRVERSSPLMTF